MSPTDALHVLVTDVRYPVTDTVLRDVFAPVRPVRHVEMLPPTPHGTAAVVHFDSAAAADECRRHRDGQYIYNDCNRLQLTFAQSRPPPRQAVLSLPQQPVLPPPPSFDQTFDQTPQPSRGGRGFGGRGGAPAPWENPRGRGRGRGGRGGGFDASAIPPPALSAPNAPNAPQPGPVDREGRAAPVGDVLPVLSIAFLDEGVPLQHLFTLIEVYGLVHSMRRNFQKPRIVMVKLFLQRDADMVVKSLQGIPFFEGTTVSARTFENFVDRAGDPMDSGDPFDAETRSFNFCASRHRPISARSQCPPSTWLKVLNVARSADEVRSYFASLGLLPCSVAAERGTFVLSFDNVGVAVRALVLGTGRVCGEERSHILFVEPR